ncbi:MULTISPECIES: DegT/DnrJ/EryC1/StrS family aminotransferase [unclassified Pseudomonas]|uniref:DegT/DnrJ/EryC1/StrS family aminotransferase n=1 Tax=unclassified Pseudomonas TaxID=196821 RepID=UPI002AC89A4B|nr:MULTISPECIES: DegT/DnrJ/EryC1/StrS family aminotransferase [unclassified Pseudomonas]MEB0042400.1 DegT/DnrJ/EryC1/StrS family aminotransferase [Pseudomonas sp. MH10]MEB0079179.1 DegT/DnrJ/EryC1/StrS family aminotransferase [Pseudomonas sp. MH10out]MEB0092377.1 DegT/DnrJ/EryC1/StrS family aminotransferase [Pseudomonas sp. CCI4.2]MEB0102124.1 DegT/DnrJ/EryC1/StrS family aminotransferase [Pseudomonas sp. CCI3.2]MEB0122109.1 DegT/DnrJ/EryC1/StrS family aminotransferase [Pseudomonas sp. CCI1.2]
MINVTKTYLGDINKFKTYVDGIYARGWLTNHGPLVTELEQRLKDYLGVKHVLLTNNGTLALQVAYRALGLTGSAVTTPFSFVATSSSLQWEGIRPIFADIDDGTWNISPEHIESRIVSDTTAIVGTHVFGNPCAVERIEQIALKHKLKVVYDGAHAFAVRHAGKSVLNWGDISTLSFHATKLFHTIEGGAIITNDDELARKVYLLCNFGIAGVDTIEGIGINAKMNEFSAAMGLCILDDLENILEKRAEIAHRYQSRLGDYLDLQQPEPYSELNHSYFPVGLTGEQQLLRVRGALNDKGINPRRYFYPSLDTLDYLQPQAAQSTSRALAQRVLCLPIYPGLAQEDQDKVIDTLITECTRGRVSYDDSVLAQVI